MEILSLVGTACTDGVHFHISVSKESGEVVGGHLMDGCLVASTAEIIIMKVEVCVIKISQELY
jgi:predicted DNA-binding protein with PD1-like motif